VLGYLSKKKKTHLPWWTDDHFMDLNQLHTWQKRRTISNPGNWNPGQPKGFFTVTWWVLFQMYVYVYIYIYIISYMYVCINIYIYLICIHVCMYM
jgi:hypothetical protein